MEDKKIVKDMKGSIMNKPDQEQQQREHNRCADLPGSERFN